MDLLWRGTQYTESEEHPGWRSDLGVTRDVGGNFYTKKSLLETKVNEGFASYVASGFDQTTVQKYWGPLTSVGPNVVTSMPPSNESSISTLNAMGATAVARCKPTNRLADVSTFLGELLKDGVPKMIGQAHREKTRAARKLGNEYLNLQFGWKPIVADVNDFIRSTILADEILTQLKRDAGRPVRRGYSFPPERTLTSRVVFNNHHPFMTVGATWTLPGKSPKGQLIHERETYRRRWFSGAFTYPMPPGLKSAEGLSRAAQKARLVYGAELTPAVVWNLAPWSWAVDWFTNVGDVLSNISSWASDGLVMHYGYIMEHSFVRDTYSYAGETNFRQSTYPQALSFVTETKIRRRANPFGFGVSWDGLSPTQVLILSALGVTRGDPKDLS
jgi:hypothetical protein